MLLVAIRFAIANAAIWAARALQSESYNSRLHRKSRAIQSTRIRLGNRLYFRYPICPWCEEQIQKWADETEAGHDVDELKHRGRGRLGRGAEPMQIVAVRLTVEEREALDLAAAKGNMSRSEAIRAALAHFAA